MTQVSQERSSPAAAGEPQGGWLPPPPERPARSRRQAAAVALAALVTGVPAALALSVGSPLPDALPALGDAAGALSGPLSPSLIVEALALVAWVAWAHFAVCVTVELSAAIRGSRTAGARPAPRVPLGGLSQQLARRLVEAALVTATVATSVGAFTGSGTILTPARPALAAQESRAAIPVAFPAQHEPSGGETAATAPATPPAPRQQPGPPRPEYVVQPPHGGYYDSLWDIAERFLGDGQRWREIYELNKSREQPDGRALTRPELIRPGWTLYLPTDATGLPAGDAEVGGSTEPAPPHDADPSPAESGAGPSPAARPTEADAPGGPQASAPSHPQASVAEAEPATSQTAAPSPSALPYTEDPDAALDGDEDDDSGAPTAAAVGGLLAAAALAVVATLRHRQRRRRPENGSIPLPEPSVARVEGQLRILAEPDDLEFVDKALRALTLSLQEDDLPDVRSALLRPDRLDLRLAQENAAPPPPFVASDAGLTWRVSTHERPLVSTLTSGQLLPLLPLLLTVGCDPDGPVLLDLEALGSLALEGVEADVLGVLTHLGVEAVLAPWAEGVEVLVVGFETDIARSLQLVAPDRVTAVSEFDASLLRVLEMRSSRVAAAGDPLRARIRGSGVDASEEVRPPLLVVHALPLSPAHAERLHALVPPAGRGGVVVVGPTPWPEARATWTLGDAPPGLNSPAPTPARLDGDQLHALVDMLQTAREGKASESPGAAGREDSAVPPAASSTEERPPSAQPPLRALTPPTVPADPTSQGALGTRVTGSLGDRHDELDQAVEAYVDDSAPVTVGLLGPITVHATGSIEPDRRARLTEIVAYLATHRAGAPLCDFDAAIWPDRPVTLKTRNQAITRTRAWLGADEEGVSWLRPLSDGALRLSRRVLVDWELFQALQKRARQRGRSRPDVRRDLETALRLVRGRPLSQLPARRYGWLAETYLEQAIPSAVIDAAHSLARILLEDGDADAALGVARVALDVDRYDERPWRDLLQAHELRGEHRQIALLVKQLHELLDIELDDELQPETAELIERLSPRRRRA
jgi:DNA-binding SARP family transcriptional activator